MNDTPDEFSAVAKDILAHQGIFSWREYLERHSLDLNPNTLQTKWKRWAKKNGHEVKLKSAAEMLKGSDPPPPTNEIPSDEYQQKIEEGQFITTDSFAKYLYCEADVASFFKIDTDVWEVDRATTNYWEQGARIKIDGKTLIAKTPLYQLKLTWKRKSKALASAKEILSAQIRLSDFPQHAKINTDGKDLSVEIMVTDLHLGKVGFNADTMAFNWTLQDAAREYNAAVDHFLANLPLDNIAEFVLPVGNDLLNVDNSSNQTRRGTPQMAGDFWQQVFRYGKNLTIAVIEKLSAVAPVFVYIVPGNHDEDSIFALGEVLDAYFSDSPNVHVFNTPIKRKYHEFGTNMVGYSHGHEFKMAKAMQTMATDEPLMFGRTRYRSFHFGHLHQNKIGKIVDISYKEEHFGIDVEICPSMSPMDEWHYKNAFIGNLRRTKCFVRHRENGLVVELYYNVI